MSALEILFEDRDLVVVFKLAGRPVHPSPGHETFSLTEELIKTRPEMSAVGSAARPGVVHRLDIETSGVMVFAKTPRAYTALRADFESHHEIEKTYLAVVHGVPTPKRGTLETTIGRKAWDARRMAVNVPDGARAVTHWTVMGTKAGVSLVEFKIETGRTHQIRVHAAHLGCPIVGDALYGDAAKDRHLRVRPKRLLLHAVALAFKHPITHKPLRFIAPPPSDIVYAI